MPDLVSTRLLRRNPLHAAPVFRIVVHNHDHVRLALQAWRTREVPGTLELWSPPDAVRWQGPRWLWLSCINETTEQPAEQWDFVLDCGDAAGMALTALRDGVPAIAIHNLHQAAAKTLVTIAHTLGQRVIQHYPERLDLDLCPDTLSACRALLCGDRDAIKGALCSGPSPDS